MLRKLFRPKAKTQFDILEKETVDEIIFRTINPRNRLMLEHMARGAMRIGEVLEIVPNDISERKILLREPKSGREYEMIFIPLQLKEKMGGFRAWNHPSSCDYFCTSLIFGHPDNCNIVGEISVSETLQ